MVHFVQLWTNKKPNKDLIKESLETSMLVENKIESIKDNHKADRVWISQFHNGGHYYPTGKSIQKFSMFYETVSLGTISVKMGFQNIPVSLFTRYINHLSEKGIVNIPDFEDETVATYGLKYIAEENNVKSSYIFAIRSIEGRFIGVLGVEYTKDKIKLDEDEIVELEIEATSIGGVLMGLLQTK
jgi:hypothetical protein